MLHMFVPPDEDSYPRSVAMTGSAADFLTEVILLTIQNLFSSISAG
ncbi:hypothetical protein ACFC06_05735 [Nocardia sp. NPDC056064]|nr:hypothetical protein [Nocardia sp. AG03]